MHSRDLLEQAGLVAFQNDTLIKSTEKLNDDAIAEYWITTRCLLDHWGRKLRKLSDTQSAGELKEKEPLLALGEEIVQTGVLIRIMTAICAAHDRYYNRQETESIAINLLQGYKEAEVRHRRLAATWWAPRSEKQMHIRSLRKQTEYWSDIFLSYISMTVNVDHLCFSESRVQEFSYDARMHKGRNANQAWQLLLVSLRSTFENSNSTNCDPELNQRISSAVLGIFGSDMFDGFGLLKSPQMMRTERQTIDSFGKVEQLLAEEAKVGQRIDWCKFNR